jgi:hypothetical protein
MIHFSCDLCGKDIHPADDQRYVIQIETKAASDPAKITDADLDEDNLEAVSEILRDLDEPQVEDVHRTFRFDLCCDCHKRFVRDPLGKEQEKKLFFSKN